MKQSRQRGYVVVYVIVGIILAAIALATLYGLRQLSAQNQVVSSTDHAATNDQQKVTSETKTDNKPAEKKNNDEKKDTSSAESKKPAQQPQQHAQNQPTPPAQNSSRGPSSHLPATGPTDSLAVGFVLGLIVATGFAYRRSMLTV